MSRPSPGLAIVHAPIQAALLVLAAIINLSSPPLAAAPAIAARPIEGTALVMRSLSGPANSPMANGEVGIVAVSARDRRGRLMVMGVAASEGDKKGVVGGGADPASAGGKAGAVDGGTAPAVGGSAIPSPASASSIDDIRLYDIARDSRLRVVSLSERKGGGPVEAVTSFFRDDLGRLIRVERRDKGDLIELDLQWEGSGRLAYLSLLDGKGAVKESGILRSGEAGIADRTALLSLIDGEGAEAGGLSLAWDSGGRLTKWEVLADPKKARAESQSGPATPAVGQAAAAQDAPATPSGSASASGSPGIEDLLFPIWPRDAASLELFAELAAPDARGDFGALASAGPLVLPFDRPKEGAIEFLWDGQGRVLEERRSDSGGSLRSSISCRYDQRGLLAEEDFLESKETAKAESPSPMPGAPVASTVQAGPHGSGTGLAPSDQAPLAREALFFFYRPEARGQWADSSSFALAEDSQASGPSPHAWFAREKLVIPPPGTAGHPSASP